MYSFENELNRKAKHRKRVNKGDLEYIKKCNNNYFGFVNFIMNSYFQMLYIFPIIFLGLALYKNKISWTEAIIMEIISIIIAVVFLKLLKKIDDGC